MHSPRLLMPTSSGAAVTTNRRTGRVNVDRHAAKLRATSAAIKTKRICSIPFCTFWPHDAQKLPESGVRQLAESRGARGSAHRGLAQSLKSKAQSLKP